MSFDGEFYKVKNLKLNPPLSKDLIPDVLMSGSSDASRTAAEILGATAVKYPKAPSEDEGVSWKSGIDSGIRTGIIARETETAPRKHFTPK